MAVSLMKKQMIEFVRPGLSLSEIIDKKIEEHVAEVRLLVLSVFYIDNLYFFRHISTIITTIIVLMNSIFCVPGYICGLHS